MDFVDRVAELALLKDHLTRPGAGLVVVFGRRRIGKTALLARALEGRPRAAYHVGTRSTLTEELRRLSGTLAAAWDLPLLAVQPLASVDALLALLRSVRGRSALVLDEFPFLIESEPALPGLLQAAWDQHLSASELKLVLCGSSVSVMEEQLLSPRAPLFGRRTGQLVVGPLLPHHLARAFPWDAPRLVELHAVFGGVPGYLGRLDPAVDLWTNLARHVLRQGEPLYEEVPFLLREELREPRVYFAILATIAAGARRFGEISSKVGLDRANLSRYLATLAALGLVEREVPVTELRPDKSRKGLYRIADPFVASWFTLVHPHRDALERGRLDQVEARVRDALQRHLPLAVEPALRSLCREGPLRDLVPFEPVWSGRSWTPTSEIDIVLLDAERRRAFVAEVKWGARPAPLRVAGELRRAVAADPALAGLECTYAVLSGSGFESGARDGDTAWVDLRGTRLQAR